MNLTLPFIPRRPVKPRTEGINMVMDKGLSCSDAAGTIDTCGHLIDFVKLGFGTAAFTRNLKEKVRLYHQAGIRVYLGGTLFEACLVRDALDEYFRLADALELTTAEISDGSMILAHDRKCELIRRFAARFETVLSEVGSKVAGHVIPTREWIDMMQKELEAGSAYVIAEARESGNVGIFDPHGAANREMIGAICENIDPSRVLWEAPLKAQQVWFIRQFGANVNLGNISYNEVIALETLRCGLRGDTFGEFLPEELKEQVQK